MISLIKMNFRLLCRNKGFLFFLMLAPIVSAVILNIKVSNTITSDTAERETVIELSSCSAKAAYSGDAASFIVKVYDASQTELSEYMLEQLAQSGMFSICRADAAALTEKEAAELARKDAFDDGAGMILYLKEGFDEAALEGSADEALTLYRVSEDERQELFLTELAGWLERICRIRQMTNADADSVQEMLADIQESMPKKEVVSLTGKNEVVLTQQQSDQHQMMGYALAIITLGFMFCGIFVAHSVIDERDNKVFTRIMLTKVSPAAYFVSKFVMVFVISILQTAVLAAALACIPAFDVGMSRVGFLTIVLLLGLICGSLSLMLGILIGDVMSSNYAAFAVWSISALLSGLYFPIENSTAAFQVISYLMPQRWFMQAGKLLLVGDKSAYSMLLLVTAAFLLVIFSVGAVGIKTKKRGSL